MLEISHVPHPEGRGPGFGVFGTSYMRAHGMRNGNQFLQLIKLDGKKIFYTVDHSLCPGQNFRCTNANARSVSGLLTLLYVVRLRNSIESTAINRIIGQDFRRPLNTFRRIMPSTRFALLRV